MVSEYGFMPLMASVREGTSTLRPSILDGANYAYWKVRMISFLKSMDNKCWKAVIFGWKYPSIKDVVGKVTLKSKLTLSKEEDEESLGNSRAINVLYNGS